MKNISEYIRAQKDHMHFTNECCECGKSKEDKDMIPIWASRASGIVLKEYFEPDYMCNECDKLNGKMRGEA
jgi:hypothetical protein